MKKTIGGLFQTKELAVQASHALQAAGFDHANIKILSRKQAGTQPVRESISIKSVAVRALIGGLVGGAVAAVLGFLIGQGVIDIPAFVPLSGPLFTLNAFGLFLFEGIVTGAIIGAVSRLATGREKPAFISSGITHGGVVVTVDVGEAQGDRAEEVMQQAGALDLDDLSEKWDEGVWSEFKEQQRS
jgi:hypothetical protein